MDGVDRLSVRLYRAGLAGAALSCLLVAGLFAARSAGRVPWPWLLPMGMVLAGCFASLSASQVHLYDKRVRWLLGAAAPFGLAMQAVSLCLPPATLVAWPLQCAGLGFGFVTLSGLGLKEQLCFRVPGMRLLPLLLAGSLVPLLVDWPPGVAGLLGPAGFLVGLLAVLKFRQPLDFDIGDKSAYQV